MEKNVLSKKLREIVERATVRLSARNAEGVLVPGGFVITAAHCISWNSDGGMVLGDHHLEPVVTKSGAEFCLEPAAVEPVADIAVLGAADGQVFYEDCETFENWCEDTTPVPVRTVGIKPGDSLGVHVLTHEGSWITGTLTRYGRGPVNGIVSLAADGRIKCGTSGGPVVDDEGALVAIVSNSMGTVPVVCQAVPSWVWDQIKRKDPKVVGASRAHIRRRGVRDDDGPMS